MFWFYVLPLGFLLTQYTITGFDASAHISEETHGAENAARQGRLALGVLVRRRSATSCCWRSRSRRPTRTRSTTAAAGSLAVFVSRADTGWAKAILIIAVVGQLFCGMALHDQRVAHDVRVLARPRGARLADLERLNQHRVPVQRRASPSRVSR